ncbi:MAG: D-alanyl-D-alanine carboxypeptidase [Oscillospiraceae bacterium]|nr:D-alanyl-D-alanine carboxypeptidase [Oscillospiraceae bacterium]
MKRAIILVLLLALLTSAVGAVMAKTYYLTYEDQDDFPRYFGAVVDLSIFDGGRLALAPQDLDLPVPFAILMEKETGTILYEKDADTQTAPASVTKVMTMLLIVEEIAAGRLGLDDMVTTSANASRMGGSQIYLKEGEQMTVRDMFKAITISSANDSSVAMAEHLMGSEAAFVARMNQRAAELGMQNTVFLNSTGLPAADGKENLTTARDVAIMSRELIRHDLVKEFTTIWMDTVRGGDFGLSNTNKLIYYYDGATGLKTGFTQGAGHCLAATAERDGVEYIAVVLGGESSDNRFEAAKALLSFAFANYTLVNVQPAEVLHPLQVTLGAVDSVQPVLQGAERLLMEQGAAARVTQRMEIAESVPAPVRAGQILGTLTVYDGETEIAAIPIVAADDVAKISTGQMFEKFMRLLFTGGL